MHPLKPPKSYTLVHFIRIHVYRIYNRCNFQDRKIVSAAKSKTFLRLFNENFYHQNVVPIHLPKKSGVKFTEEMPNPQSNYLAKEFGVSNIYLYL